MKRYFLLLLLCVPAVAAAHVPVLPQPSSYVDGYVITEPSISHAFYTELTGTPQTYLFTLSSDQPLFVELTVPDIKEARDNITGIIIRKSDNGRYEEVARLNPQDATWESFFEVFGGDSYRRGASFDGDVKAGEYLLEVSTVDNLGKYVLVVGKEEDLSQVGLFETMKRIYQVKRYFGKPPIAVMQSPFYYVPFAAVVVLIAVIVWYRKRKSYA